MPGQITLRLLLAIALLAGWQNALLHPLKHADASGALVHVAGKAPAPQPGPDANKLCDALAALTACMAGAATAAVLPAPVLPASFTATATLLSAEAPPFLSQGPPTLV